AAPAKRVTQRAKGTLLVSGTLTAMVGNRATVIRANGTVVSVILRPKTAYLPRSRAAARAGLKVGVQVMIYGRRATMVATRVAYGTAVGRMPAHRLQRIRGAVAAAGATSLTVVGRIRTVTVRLLPSTVYVVGGARTTTPPGLSVGLRV